MAIQKTLVKSLVRLSQRIPQFRARGSYSGMHRLKGNVDPRFAKSELEFQDHESFLANLPRSVFEDSLHGQTVLDFGSGYGGRTVWLAQVAEHVEGVEVMEHRVDISAEYAQHRRRPNVRFSLGDQSRINFPDDHFDTVVTLDVLEHVDHPDLILNEFYRVLKPGGTVIAIFTPWLGMFSHHLNYITLLPALHWFFDTQQIVEAVNELLESEDAFKSLNISRQPDAPWSFNRRRRCLPTVNGMTKPEYLRLLRKAHLQLAYCRATPILEKWQFLGRLGSWLNRCLTLLPVADEMFSSNLVTLSTKPKTGGIAHPTGRRLAGQAA